MAGTFVQQASEIFIKGVPTSGQPVETGARDSRVDSLASQADTRPMQQGSRQEQLDAFLTWLLRFPLEQNNPRSVISEIAIILVFSVSAQRLEPCQCGNQTV